MSGMKQVAVSLTLCLAGCLEFPTEAACEEPSDCPNGYRCDPSSGACLEGDASESDGDAPESDGVETDAASTPDDAASDGSLPDGPRPDAARVDGPRADGPPNDTSVDDPDGADSPRPESGPRDGAVDDADDPDVTPDAMDALPDSADVSTDALPDTSDVLSDVPNGLPDTADVVLDVPDRQLDGHPADLAPDVPEPDAQDPDAQVPDAQVPDAQVPDAQVPEPDPCPAEPPWTPESVLWVATDHGLQGFDLQAELAPLPAIDIVGGVLHFALRPDGRRGVAVLPGEPPTLVGIDLGAGEATDPLSHARGAQALALSRDGARAHLLASGLLNDRVDLVATRGEDPESVALAGVTNSTDLAIVGEDVAYIGTGTPPGLVRLVDDDPGPVLDLCGGRTPGRLVVGPEAETLYVTAGPGVVRVDADREAPLPDCQDMSRLADLYIGGEVLALRPVPGAADEVIAVVRGARVGEGAQQFSLDLVRWNTLTGEEVWRDGHGEGQSAADLAAYRHLVVDPSGAFLFLAEDGAEEVVVLRLVDRVEVVRLQLGAPIQGLAALGRPPHELCNGRDDNCDGTVDEGYAWEEALLGDNCDGPGECTIGVVECTGDALAAVCSTALGGRAYDGGEELCNGLDDDCDGATDETGPALVAHPVLVSDPDFDAVEPRLAPAGNNVALTWIDRRAGPGQVRLAILSSDLAVLGDEPFGDAATQHRSPRVTWSGEGYVLASALSGRHDNPYRVILADAAGRPVEDENVLMRTGGMIPLVVRDGDGLIECTHYLAGDGGGTNSDYFRCIRHSPLLEPLGAVGNPGRFRGAARLDDSVALHVGPGRLLLLHPAEGHGYVSDTDGRSFIFVHAARRFREHAAALEPGIDGIGVVFVDEHSRLSFVRTSFARTFGEPVPIAPEAAGGQVAPNIHWVGGHFLVLWQQVVEDRSVLAFRRVARDGAPQRPTALTEIDTWGHVHSIAVDDHVYVTWVAYDENDIAQVYVARGPFGCGVHVPDEQ